MKKIDLHGVRHKDVERLIIAACATMDSSFVVITGQSSEMKRLVSEAAKKMDLRVRDSIENPGRVIVYDD